MQSDFSASLLLTLLATKFPPCTPAHGKFVLVLICAFHFDTNANVRKKCTFFDDPRRHSSPSDVAVSSGDTFLWLKDLARFGMLHSKKISADPKVFCVFFFRSIEIGTELKSVKESTLCITAKKK